MAIKTIAVLSPGEMGTAFGRALKAAGFEDDDPATYTRYGSARSLYHFHTDNAY